MTKSKENLPKLVTGKVRATRNPFPQYVTAEADAGGFLEWKTKKAWVMRDSILDSKMKFLPQIQAAQQEEGQEEASQHQGEEEAQHMVKVEGGEEIALIESAVVEDEDPLTVAFRKEKELDQKIKTMDEVVKNLEVQKARAKVRKQIYIAVRCALKRQMLEMMEARTKVIRRSL